MRNIICAFLFDFSTSFCLRGLKKASCLGETRRSDQLRLGRVILQRIKKTDIGTPCFRNSDKLSFIFEEYSLDGREQLCGTL